MEPIMPELLSPVPVPTVLPEDTQAIVSSVDGLANILREIRDSIRVGDAPNGRLINIGPGLSWQASVRYRMSFLITSGASGDKMRLVIGTAGQFDWINTGGNPVSIPLPLVIEPGVAISVSNLTTPAAVNWTASVYVFAEGN